MDQRLAAVLAADMAGYSRLMEADERGTLARLRTHRIELIDPSIAKNNGHIIKTTGDGMLVEFASVSDAVTCAAEIQTRMRRRNADVPEAQRIQFRIGINLGDIIFEGGDIFGDGVNVAARLEQLCGVGEVFVSGAVYHQVSDRLNLTFHEMGEKILKNLTRPVQVYQVILDEQPGALPRKEAAKPQPAGVVKPSIAVLPFANLSGDAEQEFFVDGLTEDILTELSRRHELFVISRNSTFVYKGQSVNIREAARDLGARYVVEGSVRKAGNQVRVTAQLIDAASDTHIWAERYDRTLDDIFAIQDELTSAIVATLPGRIEAAQHDQLARATPSSMAAYECVLQAKVLHHRSRREDNSKAQELIARAVALDPGYAHAHAWRGCILGQAWGYGWLDDPDGSQFALAEASVQLAASLDDNDADVHRLLAALAILKGDLAAARYHQDRAYMLNPNYDLVVVQSGELYTWMGEPEQGIEWILKAMQLNPHHPQRFWSHLARAYFTARRYGEALECVMHMSSLEVMQLAFAAACHAWLGDLEAAGRHAARLRLKDPAYDAAAFLATMHYARAADLEHLREGLHRAGLA